MRERDRESQRKYLPEGVSQEVSQSCRYRAPPEEELKIPYLQNLSVRWTRRVKRVRWLSTQMSQKASQYLLLIPNIFDNIFHSSHICKYAYMNCSHRCSMYLYFSLLITNFVNLTANIFISVCEVQVNSTYPEPRF